MGSQVCRESFGTKSRSLLEAIARPGDMSEEELDVALAEARPCAQLLCDRLSLALCFEETAASRLCKSVLPGNPGEMRVPSVKEIWTRPVLYYCSPIDFPHKVLAFPKAKYRTVNSLRAMLKQCECYESRAELVSETKSLLAPHGCTEAEMLDERLKLNPKRWELVAYSALFSLLTEDNYWLAVCAGPGFDKVTRVRFELLNGHVQKFGSKAELELKLNVCCPSFELLVSAK